MGLNLAYPPTVCLTPPSQLSASGYSWYRAHWPRWHQSQACGLSVAVLYLSELAHGSHQDGKGASSWQIAGQIAGRCAWEPAPHLPAPALPASLSIAKAPSYCCTTRRLLERGGAEGEAASCQSIQLHPGGPRQWQTEGPSLMGSHTWPRPSHSAAALQSAFRRPSLCLVHLRAPGLGRQNIDSLGLEYSGLETHEVPDLKTTRDPVPHPVPHCEAADTHGPSGFCYPGRLGPRQRSL